VVVILRFHDSANFFLPELSLVAMTLPIIEDSLLKPIQTHGATVRLLEPKTTAKPRATPTLRSTSFRY
jgi:hypothetical protein